jgi:hypothetical protein
MDCSCTQTHLIFSELIYFFLQKGNRLLSTAVIAANENTKENGIKKFTGCLQKFTAAVNSSALP